jgi:hypothetical protein
LSPESRPERFVKARPTRAITGLMHRSKTYRFDPVVPMAPTIRRTEFMEYRQRIGLTPP